MATVKGQGVEDSIRIGMTPNEVYERLGRPERIYPEAAEFDPEIDDSVYWRYPELHLDIEFGIAKLSSTPSGKSPQPDRVISIQYRREALGTTPGGELTRTFLRQEFGEPDDVGEIEGDGERLSWELHCRPETSDHSLMTVYDSAGQLVRLHVVDQHRVPCP